MTGDNPYLDDESDQKAARQMDETVKTVFAPIYPLIADQIVAMHGIHAGTCLDLGSGPGALSIALARKTDLHLYAVDKSRHSNAIAIGNIGQAGLSGRITTVQSDIVSMPFESNFADLIISRGSLFFWEDLPKAFTEIYRVLKPGGKTHIGGGFGSPELKKKIFEIMSRKNDGFEENVKKRQHPENMARILQALDHALTDQYQITRSEAGFWIHMKKERPS